MQGDLHELNIASLCRIISSEQKTGELWVTAKDKQGNPLNWQVFLEAGKIIYANHGTNSLDRLRDYLFGLNLDSALAEPNVGFVPQLGEKMREYEQLWWLLQERVLDPVQARRVLTAMIEEVLFDLLSLETGYFNFSFGSGLRPQLVTLPLASLIPKIHSQVQQWYQIFPHIPSLSHIPRHSDPIDADNSAFDLLIPLEPWLELETNPSIRQIARYRCASMIHVVKEVYEAIGSGVVLLIAPPTTPTTPAKPHHILCIDDSLAACRSLEYILQTAGYQVTSSTDPLQALSIAFQIQPRLILCDVTMPHLSGYELCAMLRQARQFADIPIIFVTCNEGYLDRSQARLSGSTDYLTKPVAPKELLAKIAKHLKSP